MIILEILTLIRDNAAFLGVIVMTIFMLFLVLLAMGGQF